METWNTGVTTDLGSHATAPMSTAGGNAPAIAGVVAAGGTTAQGSTDGGDAVVITGSDFTADSQVSFGGVAAADVAVIGPSEMIAVTPAHTAGSTTVSVSNASGTSPAAGAAALAFADSNDGGSPPGGGTGGGSSGGNGSGSGGQTSSGDSGTTQPIDPATLQAAHADIGAMIRSITELGKTYQSTSDPDARQVIMQQVATTCNQICQRSAEVGETVDIDAIIDRNLNGMGDEARGWSLAQRYYEALKYAYSHGQFGDAVQAQLGQLVDVLTNPQALAEFAGMMALGFAIKRGVCAAGKGSFVGPLATVALTAGEVGAIAIRIDSLNQQLNTVKFKSEIADYSPQVAEFTVEMLKDQVFLKWVQNFVCFPAGTPVVVGHDGDRFVTRPIESLRPGDKVLAREEFGTTVGLCPITSVSVRKTATLLRVHFRGSDEHVHAVSCTPSHPFWVEERSDYVSADELIPGDSLTGPAGDSLTFLSFEREDLPDATTVYNFEVAEAHTYFVTPSGNPDAAVLVHNAGLLSCRGNGAPDDHHIQTDKNNKSTASGGPYTPKFEDLANKRGTTLQDRANIMPLPGHRGPHPDYNKAVYDRMKSATEGLKGDAFNQAYDRELARIRIETATVGSVLNKLATKTP